MTRPRPAAIVAGSALAACVLLCAGGFAGVAAQVPFERLVNADAEPDNWLTYSGNYASHRFSALDRIHRGNVSDLKVIWAYQMSGGLIETTPVVVDGVMYVTEPPSNVSALDARTGAPPLALVRRCPCLDEEHRLSAREPWRRDPRRNPLRGYARRPPRGAGRRLGCGPLGGGSRGQRSRLLDDPGPPGDRREGHRRHVRRGGRRERVRPTPTMPRPAPSCGGRTRSPGPASRGARPGAATVGSTAVGRRGSRAPTTPNSTCSTGRPETRRPTGTGTRARATICTRTASSPSIPTPARSSGTSSTRHTTRTTGTRRKSRCSWTPSGRESRASCS